MFLELVEKNPYVAYLALLGAILRVSRFFIKDEIFDGLRNRLLYRKKEQGHSVNKEMLQYETETIVPDSITGAQTTIKTQSNYPQPPKFVVFLRKLFACSWCLPVWITGIMLPLTILFPGPMGIINIALATAYIVSVIYSETA